MLAKLLRRAEDQGRERYRRAGLTSLVNLVSQALHIATGLISVPLVLGYVGAERFGLWMALSTALLFIHFSDFGVGIGVQDRVASHVGQKEMGLARNAFLAGLFFAFILACLFIGVSDSVLSRMKLDLLLGLKTEVAIDEAVPTAKMLVLTIALGLLAGIVQRTYSALQEGFWIGAIQAAARLVSLGLLFWIVNLKLGLPSLVFVVGGLTSTIVIILGLPLLFLRHSWLRPSISCIKNVLLLRHLGEILKVGGWGLGAAIAIYLVNNAPMILISTKYGAESVTDYAVLMKLVGVPTAFLIYILSPLGPAITNAKMNGDIRWIKKLYSKCSYWVIIMSIVSTLAMGIFGKWVIEKWAGNSQIVPSTTLLFFAIIFMLLGFWNALNSTLLNGMSRFRGQATYGLLFAVAFGFLASIVPLSMPKESILLVISVGYLFRCILMHYEVLKVVEFKAKS